MTTTRASDARQTQHCQQDRCRVQVEYHVLESIATAIMIKNFRHSRVLEFLSSRLLVPTEIATSKHSMSSFDSCNDYCLLKYLIFLVETVSPIQVPSFGGDAIMLDLSKLFRYWLFTSAFFTIYIILDSLLHSAHGFMQLYYSWSECVAFNEDFLYIGPMIRSIVVAILAFLFLRMQQVCLSILWPKNWLPRTYVARAIFNQLYINNLAVAMLHLKPDRQINISA